MTVIHKCCCCCCTQWLLKRLESRWLNIKSDQHRTLTRIYLPTHTARTGTHTHTHTHITSRKSCSTPLSCPPQRPSCVFSPQAVAPVLLCSRAQRAVTFKGFVTRCSCAPVCLSSEGAASGGQAFAVITHSFQNARIQRQVDTLTEAGGNRWKTRAGAPSSGSVFRSAASCSKNLLPAPVNPSDVIWTSCSPPSVDVHLFQHCLLLEDKGRLCCSCCCCPTSPMACSVDAPLISTVVPAAPSSHLPWAPSPPFASHLRLLWFTCTKLFQFIHFCHIPPLLSRRLLSGPADS